MIPFLVAIATAFGVVFVAELGDKTQLLALGFGARHGLGIVAIGLTLGYAAAGAIAAFVGGALGAAVPERPLAIAAGALFLLFALMTLRGGDEDEDEAEEAATTTHVIRRGSVIASIALTIALGEMGDKTQLATAALAAQQHPIGTWVGATVGEVAAGMVGAVAGRTMGHRISERWLRWASAVLFAGFGLLLLLTA